MSISRRIALLWLFWPMAMAPAQEPSTDPLPRIATAEGRLAKGDVETAVLLLWEAEDLARELPPGVARDAVAASLNALLPRADPLQAERQALGAAAARRLIEVALGYKQRKWFELAADRLRVAARFDAAAASKELAALPSTRAAATPAPAAAAAPAPLLAAAANSSPPGWTKTGDTVVAPPKMTAAEAGWYLLEGAHADCDVRCEVRIGAGPGGAGLMFGATSPADCCVLCLYHVDDHNVALVLMHSVGGRGNNLAQVDDKNRVGDGFHTIVLRVRGSVVEATADGGPQLRCTLPAAANGRIGLYAPGNHQPPLPASFRNLAIAKAADAAAAAPAADGSAERASILADVQRSEKLLADKKTEEEGILLLRQVWARVRQLPAGVVRDSFDASIAQLLQKADPLHARRMKAAADVGALLAGLAEKHRAAGRLLCARTLLQQAADFDRANDAALAAVVGEIAAAEAKAAAARAAELQPPVIAGDLVGAWFGGGKPLHHLDHSWRVSPTAAVAEVDEFRWSGLFPVQEHLGGHLRVHVHLPRADCMGGFLFDARGNNDCGLCCLARHERALALEVHRFYEGKWRRLARSPVPLPAWRLDGWLQLEIDANAAGVVARAYDVQVTVERSKLGALGPLGLCASANGDAAATIDLRGLTVVE